MSTTSTQYWTERRKIVFYVVLLDVAASLMLSGYASKVSEIFNSLNLSENARDGEFKFIFFLNLLTKYFLKNI